MALRPHVAVGLLLSGISGKCRFSRKHSLCPLRKQIGLRELGEGYGQTGEQTTRRAVANLAEKMCSKEQLHAATSTAPESYRAPPPRHRAHGGILGVVNYSGAGIFGKMLKFGSGDADGVSLVRCNCEI